jgi:hypothetical protein
MDNLTGFGSRHRPPSIVRCIAMGTALDYATGLLPRHPDPRKGYVAAAMAAASAACIVYRSYVERMAMLLPAGEWCGTPAAMAQRRLYTVGLLLAVPAAAAFVGWRHRVGLRVSRTSLVVAAGGWLACTVSAASVA